MLGFEIGWGNAWVFALGLWVPAAIAAGINKEAARRLVDTSWYPSKAQQMMTACMAVLAVYILYSIGVPLRPGTACFILGVALYAFGFVGLIATYAVCVKTPIDQPFEKGPYRISRNPLYFFTGVALFGVSAASTSWVLVLLLIPFHFMQHKVVLAEEGYCLERYGEDYRKYTKRVARYFLFF
jgi:protein-S-isoprenylcysteine O-methyltransferase Ste14